MTDSDTTEGLPPRSIDLTAEDWQWVTYRKRTPQARPKPKSFNKEEAIERLKKVKLGPYDWGQQWNWSPAKIAVSLSREEAVFWLVAMTAIDNGDAKYKSYSERPQLVQDLVAVMAEVSTFEEIPTREQKEEAEKPSGRLAKVRQWLNKPTTVPQAVSSRQDRALPYHVTARLAPVVEFRSKLLRGPVSLDDIRARLAVASRMAGPQMVLPLYNLLPLEEFGDLIAGIDSMRRQMGREPNDLLELLVDGFRTYLLPHLEDAEIGVLRQRVRMALEADPQPAASTPTQWPLYRLAACLGMHAEIYQMLSSLPDDAFHSKTGPLKVVPRPQEIIFGLGDARLVESEMRRLGQRLTDPTYIRAWLAHTQYEALDLIHDSILLPGLHKQVVEGLLKTFAIVHAPEAARYMLSLMLSSQATGIARQWLYDNPEHAIAGVMPIAGKGSKLGLAALEFLIDMERKGYGSLINRCLEQASVEVVEEIRAGALEAKVTQIPFSDETTPAWLIETLPKERTARKKESAWADPTLLPPVVVGERRLNDDQVSGLLGVLRHSDLDRPAHPLIAGLKENANLDALGTFAWALFEQWLKDGGAAKEKWALIAVGLLGNDNSVLKLAPLIRKWPGESQHQRAALGLSCLRAIGTDTALMQINGIAQKLQYQALKAKAKEMMEAIAQARNLSREQLEDRIVPDCDLDERGGRVFDFGPRQFRFVLTPEMKPMVRDGSGKLQANLPKPGVKDDAGLAEQAVADWNLLKKQVHEVVKIQAVRLEQAMVTGRRWSVGEFEMLLVHHPLMVNLARMLLWGGYDEADQLAATFRVTEDQTYADVKDEDLHLGGLYAVGLVHPLQLSEERRAAWGEMLSDYEIVPPFPQLGREVYHLTDAESTANDITRFAEIKVPAISLAGTLERLGWARGIPQDAGIYSEHSKPFYGANATAIVQYQGIPIGYMEGWEDQVMECCFFVPGIYTPAIYQDHKKKLILGTIDPVAISEVLRDLSIIAAKAKS